MTSLLGHFSLNGVKSISEIFSAILNGLSSKSLKYFNKSFLIVPEAFSIGLICGEATLTMRQLLRKAVLIILNSDLEKFKKNSNVLTFGFRKTINEITSLFPNHLHFNFLAEPWTELHQRIGDDLMIYLLTECSIFVNISESNSLIQIAGKPLSEENVKVPAFNSTDITKALPFLSRTRIMYGRSVCSSNFNIIGLPFNHLLNCKSVDVTDKMFYNDLKFTKRSWQFKKLHKLSTEFLKNHQKCPYSFLYNYYTQKNDQLTNYQVFAYLSAILKRTLPKNFRDNKTFMNQLHKKIWLFLGMPRFEKLSVNELIHGLELKKCLKIFDPKSKLFKPSSSACFNSPSEHEKIKKLMKNFLKFLFENFLIDLLRSNFYITEASTCRSKIVYFRHDRWLKMTLPVLELYQETMFHSTDSKIWSARCRLVPKDNGKFRPVMAFKKPPSTDEGNRLRASFDILKYFQEIDSSLSVNGFSSIQSRLLYFKSINKSLGPFYFAKLDISSCFDSIPHDKLFELLSFLLEGNEFSVRRVDQVQLDLINRRPKKLITRIAHNLNDSIISMKNNNFSRNCCNSSIVVDRVNGKFYEGRTILNVIYDHICNNIVQINGKMFKQTKGIPQGSFLSTVLCSLFYGQFDRETGILGFPSEDLVMRYVDDFIIISPCRDRVLRFARFLESGFSNFGIIFNSEKTRFSFDSSGKGEINNIGKYFTWCGLRFHPETLDISPDYTNFEFTNIKDSINARLRNINPGKALLRQMQYFLRPKLRKLFHKQNSLITTVFNLIQSFAMVAIKTHSYCRGLHVKIQSNFLYACIENVIAYCCKLVRLKSYPNLIKSVAWNAFYRIFGRKGTIYRLNGNFWKILHNTCHKEFPLPTIFDSLVTESLEPFFDKIKY